MPLQPRLLVSALSQLPVSPSLRVVTCTDPGLSEPVALARRRRRAPWGLRHGGAGVPPRLVAIDRWIQSAPSTADACQSPAEIGRRARRGGGGGAAGGGPGWSPVRGAAPGRLSGTTPPGTRHAATDGPRAADGPRRKNSTNCLRTKSSINTPDSFTDKLIGRAAANFIRTNTIR